MLLKKNHPVARGVWLPDRERPVLRDDGAACNVLYPATP